MRPITRDSINAFMAAQPFKRGNMEVTTNPDDTVTLLLHGNAIAFTRGTTIFLEDCGWQTVTTKDRLNALLNEFCDYRVGIYSKNGKWYINGEDWPGGCMIDTLTGAVHYVRPATGDLIEVPAKDWAA